MKNKGLYLLLLIHSLKLFIGNVTQNSWAWQILFNLILHRDILHPMQIRRHQVRIRQNPTFPNLLGFLFDPPIAESEGPSSAPSDKLEIIHS